MKHICYSYICCTQHILCICMCECRHTNTNDLNEYMKEADLERKKLKKFGFK